MLWLWLKPYLIFDPIRSDPILSLLGGPVYQTKGLQVKFSVVLNAT